MTNPEQFRTDLIVWLAVATTVLPLVTAFVIKIIGSIAQVKQSIADLRSRQDAQSTHIVSQGKQITEIALATNPPTTNANPPTPPPVP